MNDVIRPDLEDVKTLFRTVSSHVSEEFLVLLNNLLNYMTDCYAVMEMNLPKPVKVFKKWQTHARWLSVERKNPNLETLFNGEWIKVYKVNEKYYLALSPIKWTSTDSIDRFD